MACECWRTGKADCTLFTATPASLLAVPDHRSHWQQRFQYIHIVWILICSYKSRKGRLNIYLQEADRRLSLLVSIVSTVFESLTPFCFLAIQSHVKPGIIIMARLSILSALLLWYFTSFTLASSFLELCPFDANSTIADSAITWSQVLNQPIKLLSASWYLRPNIGIHTCLQSNCVA